MAEERRRPLPGEGSDRLGTNFDVGLPAGEPEESISYTVSAGLLSQYVTELTQVALRERLDLETGQMQARNVVAPYQGLHYLRGFWPFTSLDENQDVIDLSGQGRKLTKNGSPSYGYAGVSGYGPSVNLNVSNTSRYFSRADETGLNYNGFNNWTMLAWVLPIMASSTGRAPIMAKGDGNTGDEYGVHISRSNMRVHVKAGADTYDAPSSRALTDSAWNFVAAGFHVGLNQYQVFVNGGYTTASGGSPSPTATTDPFYLGRYDNGASSEYWSGSLALVALVGTLVAERQLRNVYEATRRLFGV